MNITLKQCRVKTTGRIRVGQHPRPWRWTCRLAEKVDPKKLVLAAKADVELSVVERTGFLLDQVGAHRVTGPLAERLAAQKPNVTRLRPDRDAKHSPSDGRWLVIVNEKVEADE